jgi:lycopene beta-cyclase
MSRWDVALIGFGAAAMSLATRLGRMYSGTVVIIEPRTLPANDRTWCGWRTKDHPFSELVTRQWPQWRVGTGPNTIIRGSDCYPYEMLRAGDVQSRALEVVEGRPDWRLAQSRLTTATRQPDGWALELDSGETLAARYVLDSRPPPLTLQRPWVWQSFVGWELSHPALDGGDTVGLMDFTGDSDAVAEFVYELPIEPGHHLLEWTRFTASPPPASELAARLETHLHARGLGRAQIMRREHGHLPMAPIAPYQGDDWMRIGTAGGSMRPATGYAFHAIQRWADDAARCLLDGQPPRPPRRRGLLDWLDGVFLESLWQTPGQAPSRFAALFRQTPPEALIRFLAGTPKKRDLIAVMRALPPAPLLSAAIRHSLRRDRH